MRRNLVLEAVDHSPPSAAVLRTGGLHDLSFDLRNVFHHGYIEVHDRPPKAGTNPLYDEYVHLLDPESDYLIWSRGIGRGDHKASESHKLGRIFARAYLAFHGYTWFPDVEALCHSPQDGWSVRRRGSGNMPDWLVGDGLTVAVAEAKGTHSLVHKDSKVLTQHWRPQVQNILVFKDGTSIALKGWIIATRWVNSDQRRTLPKMYAEDPHVPGERHLGEDELGSIGRWLARLHTARNLRRLGHYAAALRVMALGRSRSEMPPAKVTTWTCSAPGMGGMQFVGRPVGELPPTIPLGPLDWRFFRELVPYPVDRQLWEKWSRLWSAWLEDSLDEMWFDGLALSAVQSLVRDELPPPIEAHPEGVLTSLLSLLRDGSLLAPISLMTPGQRVEV